MKSVRNRDLVEGDDPGIAGCSGKQAFPSWRMAQRAVDRKNTVKRLRGEDLACLTVYACRSCGQFHIGGRA